MPSGTVLISLPSIVLLNCDQALSDGQQESPGKQRHAEVADAWGNTANSEIMKDLRKIIVRDIILLQKKPNAIINTYRVLNVCAYMQVSGAQYFLAYADSTSRTQYFPYFLHELRAQYLLVY